MMTFPWWFLQQQRGRRSRSRLTQILDWLGEDFDGCLLFDESHRAKNLMLSSNKKDGGSQTAKVREVNLRSVWGNLCVTP